MGRRMSTLQQYKDSSGEMHKMIWQQWIVLVYHKWQIIVQPTDRGLVGNSRQRLYQMVDRLFKDMRNDGLFCDDDYIQEECLKFCFMNILRDELQRGSQTGNAHRISPPINVESPSGRPDVLFFSSGSVKYQNLHNWCWFGRIRTCRKKMLLQNSGEWLLWRIRSVSWHDNGGKQFAVSSHRWRCSNIVRQPARGNRKYLEATSVADPEYKVTAHGGESVKKYFFLAFIPFLF